MYERKHHNIILHLLKQFDSQYLSANNILFGGGTRIALELGEYRESIDIDFLCPNTASYRAARSVVSSMSLGELVDGDIALVREVRTDRDAIRTVAQYQEQNVKIEFIRCDDYLLTKMLDSIFPVDCIDRNSCFQTKLLAHADRYMEPTKKDFIDLLFMQHFWGLPSKFVWAEVTRHYGDAPRRTLQNQLVSFLSDTETVFVGCSFIHLNLEQHKNLMIESARAHGKKD